MGRDELPKASCRQWAIGSIAFGALIAATVIWCVGVAFSSMGGQPVHVQLHVQRSDHLYKLPMGQSPRSLADFLNAQSRHKYHLEPVANAVSVYATIAEENRLAEVIDKDQVLKAGSVKAFILVWIKPPELCVVGQESQDIERYVREHFTSVESVAFVCHWNPGGDPKKGFSDVQTKLSQQSLKRLDRMLVDIQGSIVTDPDTTQNTVVAPYEVDPLTHGLLGSRP